MTTEQTGLEFEDTIMGLDLSSRCVGWSVLRGPHYETGHVKFKGYTIGHKLITYRDWLADMVRMHQPSLIVKESVFVGNNGNAVIPLIKYHGVTEERLADFVGVVLDVPSATWKKTVCGRGNITTKEKEAGAILNILSAMGFAVGQIDEGDALCVALCKRKEFFGRLK